MRMGMPVCDVDRFVVDGERKGIVGWISTASRSSTLL